MSRTPYPRRLMRLRKQTRPRGLDFEAYGVSVELAVDDPEIEPRVLENLPPGWRPCPPSQDATTFGLRVDRDDGYEVTVDGERCMKGGPLDVALALLDSRIRLHVAAHATDWTFLHAGAVALEGRVLVLPGESFSGKSTLVEALVQRGAVYYSDEYAVLDQEGRVHPYPRPLRIRAAAATEDRDIEELGGVIGREEANIAVVALTRYLPDGEWQPRTLSRGHGATLMLTNVVAAYLRPRQSLRVLTQAIRGATVLESDRGEAEPVASALLQTLLDGADGPS